MTRRTRGPAFAAACLAAVLLAGCGGGDNEEIATWMQEQRAKTQPKVEPISEPVRFVPQPYQSEGSVPPFAQEKLTSALRRAADATSPSLTLLTPELNRRKEPLEAFPLDSLDMVGSIGKGGGLVALVMAPDKVTYRVRPGVYLGQSDGRVTSVQEDRIDLVELVPDGAGGWLERPASIALEDH